MAVNMCYDVGQQKYQIETNTYFKYGTIAIILNGDSND